MLNLLPPQQKRELKLNLLNQAVIRVAISIIFMILVLVLLLLIARAIININLTKTEKELSFWQSRAEIKELEILEKNIKELNKNLIFLNGLYQNQNKFSSFLENLTRDVPVDIYFDSVSLGESGAININGYAPTRNTLINFKNVLEKALYVSDFNFPISNLTQATDINFGLNFKLKE